MNFPQFIVCQCGQPKIRRTSADGTGSLLTCQNCDIPQPQEHAEGGRRETTTADRKYSLHFAGVMRKMQEG